MQSLPRRRLLAVASLAALALAGGARAADPGAPGGAAPDVCPAVDEGFQLCANDLMSGNCEQFVQAAGQLAQLYQIQVAESPDRTPMLLSTNWWGCGEALLGDMKVLLLKLDSPAARALLHQEPFSRLPPLGPAPPPPPPAPVEVDCANEPGPDAQEECAEAELAAARSTYQSAFAACRSAVALPLRDAFAGSEQAWQQEFPAQCEASASEYDDPRLQAFARSQCLAKGFRERTRGMLLAHPECRTAR